MSRRRFSDLLLFSVTVAELVALVRLTPTFTIVDWVYVSQQLLVLGISFTRRPPVVRDDSLATSLAVAVALHIPLCPSDLASLDNRPYRVARRWTCPCRVLGMPESCEPPLDRTAVRGTPCFARSGHQRPISFRAASNVFVIFSCRPRVRTPRMECADCDDGMGVPDLSHLR